MERRVLHVEGMSCDHCRMAVTRAVEVLEGTGEVEVSLEEKTVSFRFEPEKLSLDSVIKAIEEQGYRVGPPRVSET